MADFEPLVDAEAAAFDRFERMRDWMLRFQLVRQGARSRVRIAKVVARGLTPVTRTKTVRLSALAARMSKGYARLANLDGAVRFCAAQVARTAAIARVILR